MIAGSDSSWAEAGRFIPTDRCTIAIESSTVVACRPLRCTSFSLRARQGRIKACLPWTRWLRFSFVLTCTVSSQRRSASNVYACARQSRF